ncbi:hypothetical protein ASD68_08450 [Rhodanobacter sp. Root627]|uniref:YeiH family protein n=1 Tax=Rhodanobacter sp. Root627 TaxID=1736572 RepID=UPI0006F32CD3|nr:putative sulfate exporter family transporter [Rhodanobacter sp. Root627]KRA33074.1 hypothetical protein ASD68_08450 [Rhodanobacter sp. Root627]
MHATAFVPTHPRTVLPGLVLAAAIAVLALLLGRCLPLIGGPVFGMVLGLLVRSVLAPDARFVSGIAFASTTVLQASIIALGFGLSLDQVVATGMRSLSVTVVTLSVAFFSAWLLGRWLGVHDKLKILVGVGTAICGASAIAAVTPIIQPDEHDTAYAISTIFLFNIVAVLLFPLLGHLMHMGDLGFGLWAGTAINDTSSVVAAGYSFSKAAGDYATIVKLTRATLIIPVCLLLALVAAVRARRQRRLDGSASQFSLLRIFPWFILWFLVASALRTAGLIPAAIQPDLHLAAEFLIVVALAAIGLSANLRRMIASGPRPILLGLGVWIAVATSSLLVQVITRQL